MSVLGKLVGADEAIGAVGEIVDELWTSKEEKLDKKAVIERIRQNPLKWTQMLNMIEAKHRTVFVAGWRPFIGWTCGIALWIHYIVNPLLMWWLGADRAPQLDLGDLFLLLTVMLGGAGLRSWEKKNGLTK